MSATILTGRYHCRTCVIGCGRRVTLDRGPSSGEQIGGPEYEAAGALGANCLVDDITTVAVANELCNRYGLDVISAGSAVAFAMEAYERGLITKADTDGLELTFGNGEAMVEMIRRIGERQGLGRLLGVGLGSRGAVFLLSGLDPLEPLLHRLDSLLEFRLATRDQRLESLGRFRGLLLGGQLPDVLQLGHDRLMLLLEGGDLLGGSSRDGSGPRTIAGHLLSHLSSGLGSLLVGHGRPLLPEFRSLFRREVLQLPPGTLGLTGSGWRLPTGRRLPGKDGQTQQQHAHGNTPDHRSFHGNILQRPNR
jgi:hypothetical protein